MMNRYLLFGCSFLPIGRYFPVLTVFMLCIFYSSTINTNCFCDTSNITSFKIHTFFEELLDLDGWLSEFDYWTALTEGIAYQLLKEKPLQGDIKYLAAPWRLILRKNLLKDVPKIRFDGGFTICYSLHGIWRKKIFPLLKEMGISCVFTPGATIRERELMGIHIEPMPYYPVNGAEQSERKDILYSFIGQMSHPCRRRIFLMRHPQHTIIKKRDTFFPLLADDNQKFKEMRDEYKDILSRSRFSLCPRRQQPNSIRFWESLQASAIPILISDYARLPEWFDWRSCIIRVSENAVKKIPKILSKISFEKEKEMRKNCLKAHKLFSGENLVSVIRKYYKI